MNFRHRDRIFVNVVECPEKVLASLTMDWMNEMNIVMEMGWHMTLSMSTMSNHSFVVGMANVEVGNNQ